MLIAFQAALIVSGNLSFLNWLTIIPCIACLDDSYWRRLLRLAPLTDNPSPAARPASFAALAFACVVAWLSVPVVRNLLSPNQAMNTSFDPLHLVNTYGAFGSVGRERFELIFQGTRDEVPAEFADWQDYEFKVKPGDLRRPPALITPYHHRLDWQIWFASMATPGHDPWTLALIWHLLQNDPATLGLLAHHPFSDEPPRFIRVLRYRYQFAPPAQGDGSWWRRERLEIWLPPISLQSREVRDFLTARGWISPQKTQS